jgi:PTS system nitrogen regulatory IIA component
MRIADLVIPERVRLEGGITSKKRALEILGTLLADDAEPGSSLPANLVFDALSAREKLGSTGLGHGVAIPHGRMSDTDAARVAVLRLQESVDFEAIDHEPVDILIGLVVPEAATGEHLELLAELARALSQPANIAAIRRAPDAQALHQAVVGAFGDA